MKPMLVRFSLCLLLSLLLISALAVQAQALSQTAALSDRYQIRVPSDWEVEDDSITGSTLLRGFGIGAYVYSPEALISLIGAVPGADPALIISRSFRPIAVGSAPAGMAVIDQITIDDRPAAVYETLDDSGDTPVEARYYALEMSDGKFGLVLFVGITGQLALQNSLIEDILATFDVDPAILRAETASAVGAEPCFVSVDTADTARLRVGPGFNRSSVAFLPIGDAFSVTGRIEDEDGAIWYQLDKAEAAPQSAANEIWVLAEEVEAVGDCDLVGETTAPPIVPIIPGSGTAGSGSPGGQAPPPQAVTGTVPVSGFYAVTFDSVMADASCEGTGNIQIPVAELYTGDTSGNLTVLENGARIRYGDDIWTRAPDGSPFYSGNLAFAPGSFIPNGVVYLNVINTSLLRGTLVSNFIIDDVRCSDTVAISVRRQ